MRLDPHSGASFMCGVNPNPIQNNAGKQGRNIYTPAKRLLGAGRPPATPLFIAPTGRLRILRPLSSMRGIPSAGKSLRLSARTRARSCSTCGAFARPRKRPLPRHWLGRQQADFPVLHGSEKLENRRVCTTLPFWPLLKTTK